jgi:hypothetical protein
MTLQELREQVHRSALLWRNIDLYMNGYNIDMLWKDSTPTEKKHFEEILTKGDMKALREWSIGHSSIELESKPMIILKRIAQNSAIPLWSRLPRNDLIRAIQAERNKNNGVHQA